MPLFFKLMEDKKEHNVARRPQSSILVVYKMIKSTVNNFSKKTQRILY